MKRNPEATCETCPYWKQATTSGHSRFDGQCIRYPHLPYPPHSSSSVCGEHPDFELKE